jgi:hypothetical protein
MERVRDPNANEIDARFGEVDEWKSAEQCNEQSDHKQAESGAEGDCVSVHALHDRLPKTVVFLATESIAQCIIEMVYPKLETHARSAVPGGIASVQ